MKSNYLSVCKNVKPLLSEYGNIPDNLMEILLLNFYIS